MWKINILNRKDKGMLRSREFEKIKKATMRKRIILFGLMYLAFMTAYLSMNSFSKYVGVSSGSGNVQIAKWEVYSNSNSENIVNMVAGNTRATYEVKVVSNSDVACTYSIEVSNIPNNVRIKLDNGEYKEPQDGKIVFPSCGRFDAGNNNEEVYHTLTVEADLSVGEIVRQLEVDTIFVQEEI